MAHEDFGLRDGAHDTQVVICVTGAKSKRLSRSKTFGATSVEIGFWKDFPKFSGGLSADDCPSSKSATCVWNKTNKAML